MEVNRDQQLFDYQHSSKHICMFNVRNKLIQVWIWNIMRVSKR